MNWGYTTIMIAAMISCSWLLRRWQTKLDLSWRQKVGIGVGAFVGAMIGAKLPFVLSDWQGLRTGAAWFAHGKTILCGIVGGYFGVEYAKWCLGVTIKTGDTFAVPVAVGVAVGRVGCFFGQCCYGTPTDLPWGVVFPRAGAPFVPRHPTQLYEFAFHLTLAGILCAFQRRGMFPGQLIKLYILCYLSYRFLSEYMRPESRAWLGLTAYQYATICLVPLFVALWIRDARRAARPTE